MLAIALVALFYLFEMSLQPEEELLPEGHSPELEPVYEPQPAKPAHAGRDELMSGKGLPLASAGVEVAPGGTL